MKRLFHGHIEYLHEKNTSILLLFLTRFGSRKHLKFISVKQYRLDRLETLDVLYDWIICTVGIVFYYLLTVPLMKPQVCYINAIGSQCGATFLWSSHGPYIQQQHATPPLI